MRESVMARDWSFLETEPIACGVVSQRMELLDPNVAAQALVRGAWFGTRCWQSFPVGADPCVSQCPAIRAVNTADQIVYCEETLYGDDGRPFTAGVAVIPLGMTGDEGERSILLLRPKGAEACDEDFRAELFEHAERLPRTVLTRLARRGRRRS